MLRRFLSILNLTLCFSLVFIAPTWAATQYTVLYRFQGGLDGDFPNGQMVSDASGNWYGTTQFGGTTSGNAGVVFELSPAGGGNWTETVLYRFTGGSDGGVPEAGLVIDASGNLYGTTAAGGNSQCVQRGGYCGVVFELSPDGHGNWTESVLHAFTGPDGLEPSGPLTFDKAGNLYGVTRNGGAGGYGTVYELSPNGDGTWNEAVLASFYGKRDGTNTEGNVVFDAAGNLYGMNSSGGDMSCGHGFGCGDIFKLAPQGGGTWKLSLVGSFNGPDGATPLSLVIDPDGNLFGAAVYGGFGTCYGLIEDGCGDVFELSQVGGQWQGKVIKFSSGHGATNPVGITLDSAGNIYGASQCSNASCTGTSIGTVFKLTPSAGGIYASSVLHTFTGGSDGFVPESGPVIGSDGNVYGTTNQGGVNTCGSDHGCGTIYQIIP